MKAIILLCFLAAFVVYSEALCCPWKVTSDVKCACDDGGLVHPWECCSTGACNVFCCNCGGPCRSNQTLDLEEFLPIIEEQLEKLERTKRSTFFSFDPEEFNSALHFNSVDANSDLEIDIEEALNHLGQAENGLRSFMHRFTTPVWFSKLDNNHNGRISPDEFDSMLSGDVMEKFNQFFYKTD